MNKIYTALKVLVTVMIAVMAFSCVPQKKITYIQQADTAQKQTQFREASVDYKLQSGDFLYIRILSLALDDKINKVFDNMTGGQSATNSLGEQNVYLSSYEIDPAGDINFPFFGKIHATGLTVGDVQQMLSKQVGTVLKESSVIVKLVQFNFSVLGEVHHPGRFPVYKEKINIFEALAMAGDLTTFSNRNQVRIVRNSNGSNLILTVDLTDAKILGSPQFYLQPNDIVYVETLKNKQYAFETFPYALIFSTITTALLIATYFK